MPGLTATAVRVQRADRGGAERVDPEGASLIADQPSNRTDRR
jgi:hypothetical protein